METENSDKDEVKNSFFDFQEKNRKNIQKKYENKNCKLDSVITPFIMILTSLILFLETILITLIPLLSDNHIFSKFLTLIFDFYLIVEELFLGSFYYISTSINEDNYSLLSNKLYECMNKISNIFTKIVDICYSKNKDKIEIILKNISEDENDNKKK
jgi:hypothetical protein